MRQLAWLLLLANLGMFAWLLTQPEPQITRYRPVPVPPGIEPLVLLSERSTGTDKAGADAHHAAPPAEQQVAAVADAPDDAPESDTQPETVEADATPPVEQLAPAPEPVCQTVGPFMKETDAKGISRKLAELGYQPSLRTGEVRIPAGYWVYMPSMRAAEARRIVAELDAHGMTDYYIGKQNYISLGIFSGKRKAQVRLEQVKALGFDAILDQRFRTTTVYWVDIREGETPLLGSAVWPDIQAQYAEVRVQRISCE